MTNPSPRCVRLWKDGTTTTVLECRDGVKDSLIMSEERCDLYYTKWAASDSADDFFTYALTWETNGRQAIAAPLTPEDQLIFTRIYLHGITSPIALIEGDHHKVNPHHRNIDEADAFKKQQAHSGPLKNAFGDD